ncbi:hypothetical protein [Streptomyces sp. NRRL F-2580]|uniref:hypothetical protein n=1 Tax=Streptomyces sp. NRRL F-2580 TaxID=1463841 RepID=UPI0004CB1ABE|nr:hypothetical protein [Streptomyces sp. NRRL F-2580]
MIVTFTVRSGQGEPSAFDRGDIVFSGELGEASSVGHVPDQGMMLFLAVPDLLDSLVALLGRRSTSASFTGIGSAYRLDFHTKKQTVTVKGRSGPVAQVSHAELAGAVLSAAEELASRHLAPPPPGDPAADDYAAALNRFRAAAVQAGARRPGAGDG